MMPWSALPCRARGGFGVKWRGRPAVEVPQAGQQNSDGRSRRNASGTHEEHRKAPGR